MPHMIKRTLSRISPKTRVTALTLLAAIAVGVGVAWVVANMTGQATSEEPGTGVADFSERPLTPLVIPTALPIPKTPGHCLAPEGEQPEPGLPPLPCRQSDLEPPPGAISTVSPKERAVALTSTQDVPDGWEVYDNPIFRYTFALPPDWYANMRPEGGQFEVLNPGALTFYATGDILPGQLGINLVAKPYNPDAKDRYTVHAANPNTSFGEYPGAVWEETPDIDADFGIARIICISFRRDDILFRGTMKATEGYTDSDIATVHQILNTITPY